MKEKDVLFLCQYFYPDYISSATLPYDTAAAFTAAGLRVGVLCGYSREYKSNEQSVPLKENYNGIEIRRLNYIQLDKRSRIGRLVSFFSFFFMSILHFWHIREYKMVIVYSNPPILPIIAYLAKKIFGTRFVFVCYDVYPEIAITTNSITESSLISKTMKIVNYLLYQNVDKVIALSNEMKDFLLKNRNSITDERVIVISNWYDDKRKQNIEESYSNDLFNRIQVKEKLVVSYLGNMGTAQDLNTLIGAIKYLKDETEIVFVFAGHGNKLDFLKETVKKENMINVYVFDFLHGDDFNDALNISDVFVVSLEDGVTGLAVPSKVYSYMMAGKPILSIMGKSSDISKDLVENNAGYGIEVGDVTSLVSSIQYLSKNETKRNEMGNNARKLFLAKYTTEKCTSKYVEMAKEVLEEGNET